VAECSHLLETTFTDALHSPHPSVARPPRAVREPGRDSPREDDAMMRALSVALVAIAVGAGIVWSSRDAPWARHVVDSLPGGSTGATLTTPPAGVHKCRLADGQIAYSDRPCERGTRAQAMGGGTMTTVPALGPRPAPSAASGGLVQGFDPATVDRLREQQIDAAANR
jgi:hypothetical protein